MTILYSLYNIKNIVFYIVQKFSFSIMTVVWMVHFYSKLILQTIYVAFSYKNSIHVYKTIFTYIGTVLIEQFVFEIIYF